MAIEAIMTNVAQTHSILTIECWDGKHFFIKDLKTAKLTNKEKSLDKAKGVFATLFGEIWVPPTEEPFWEALNCN